MPVKECEQQQVHEDREEKLAGLAEEKRADAVKRAAMTLLGKPEGLHCVTCREVAHHKYRLNLYIRTWNGVMPTDRIEYSYYIHTNGSLAIEKSTPELKSLA